MKYHIYEHHNIYMIITAQKDGTFVPIATCVNRANAEIVLTALNLQAEGKKKDKK